MRKIKIVSIVILGVAFLILAIIFLIGFLKPKVAGVYIESSPAATVYIDDEEVGRTPYERTHKPGEVVIKLVPDSFEAPLAPYETKINLVVGVQTVVKRFFGQSEDASSGEIISFEKIDKNQVSLAVVSIPDSAELLIDNNERVFTPHRTTTLLSGVHSLVFKANGYQEKQVDVRTYDGYKLTAVVKLAKLDISQAINKENQEEVVSEDVNESEVRKVIILSTPTGFLRVRNEPSTLGQEVGTVEPQKTYDLLDTDQRTGWYKIRFIQVDSEEEKEGWVTNQYTQVVGSVSPTQSVSPGPTP